MTNPIACSLAENALDYLILAGEKATDGSPRMVKHALATLADGVELLLKARLEIEDWKLVIDGKSAVSREDYEKGDFRSVQFDEALKRLEASCSVTIVVTDREIIEKLRKLRNKIRHFAISIDRNAAISLIVKTFSFEIAFASRHLSDWSVRSDLEMLRKLLGGFEEFVDARMAEM